MYTRTQVQILIQYYQSLLSNWQHRLIYYKKSSEPIVGGEPDSESLYNILYTRNDKTVDLVDACQESNIIDPFIVLQTYVWPSDKFELNTRRKKIFQTKSNDSFYCYFEKVEDNLYEANITSSCRTTKLLYNKSEETLLDNVRTYIEEWSDIRFESWTMYAVL